MAAQIQKTRQHTKREETAESGQAQEDKMDEAINAMLAEIDEVLEEMGEEFVANYKQAGGQ